MNEEKEAGLRITGGLWFNKDLELMKLSWKEAEIASGDRMMYKRYVAQCAEGTERTKV